MSSSHIFVNRNEYRNLQNQARRVIQATAEAARIRREAQDRERDITARYQSNMDSINRRINDIQTRHNRELNNVTADFRNRIVNQANEFRNQLDNQRVMYEGEISTLETRMGQAIGRLNVDMRAINNRVEGMSEEFNERFDSIARQITASENTKREYARVSLEELEHTLESIRGLEPERFAPGELTPLTEQLTMARRDYEGGQYEAALAITHVRLTDAGRLLSRLSILNNIFAQRLREVGQRASEVAVRMGSFASNALEFEVSGQTYSMEYDVNHWSQGAFNRIGEELRPIQGLLDDVRNTDINLEGLEEIMVQLNDLDSRITACDSMAREELIRSFVVEDMAVQVHNTLTEQGWVHGNSGHNQNDEREPYRMVYEDGTGNSIALVINSGEKPEDATLHMEVYDVEQDEIFRSGIKQGVGRHLQENGINVMNVIRSDDCAQNPDVDSFLENTTVLARQENEIRRQSKQ